MLATTLRLTFTAALMLASYELGRRYPNSEATHPAAASLPLTLRPPPPPAALVHRDAGPTIEHVRALESLVVTRVDVADVTTTDIHGYVGGSRAALLVRGDFVVAVDLARARFQSRDPASRVAVLVVPVPRASRPRLDQEKTRLVELSRQGLWIAVPGETAQSAAVNHAYRHAQRVVATAGTDAGVLARAREDAEQTLRAFFGAVGWTVTIRWAAG